VLAQDDADTPAREQPHQPLLAVDQGQAAEVLAVELQEVEDVEHRVADGPVAVDGVEDRHAIGAADDRLAVQGERPQLGSRGRDRRIAAGPIVAASGEQPDGVAVPADLQPISVVLDLVDPIGAGRRLGNAGGKLRGRRLSESIDARGVGDSPRRLLPNERLVSQFRT
jgi:hypothetical protein